jgi:hypothetical protein
MFDPSYRGSLKATRLIPGGRYEKRNRRNEKRIFFGVGPYGRTKGGYTKDLNLQAGCYPEKVRRFSQRQGQRNKQQQGIGHDRKRYRAVKA